MTTHIISLFDIYIIFLNPVVVSVLSLYVYCRFLSEMTRAPPVLESTYRYQSRDKGVDSARTSSPGRGVQIYPLGNDVCL